MIESRVVSLIQLVSVSDCSFKIHRFKSRVSRIFFSSFYKFQTINTLVMYLKTISLIFVTSFVGSFFGKFLARVIIICIIFAFLIIFYINASTIEYKNNCKHPFNFLDPSPWPLVASIGGLGMTFGGVMYMHNYLGGGTLFLTGFTTTIFVMYTWWKDIVREGTYEGLHTKQVQQRLRWGMIIFIVSEVMFFFAFFWSFFYPSLAPIFDILGVWPFEGIEVLNPWEVPLLVPLLNTVFLLSSGAIVILMHDAVITGSRKDLLICLFLIAVFAGYFALKHALWYYTAVAISDNIYEAIIFLKTVRYYFYYGFFIIVGFLTVCLMKLFYDSKQQLVWLRVIIHLNIVMNVLPFSCLKELVLVL